jgi:hypothetical protein
MQPWEKPNFEELTMNAEIGAYQADDGGDYNDVPFVTQESDSWVNCRSTQVSARATQGSEDLALSANVAP